ncbi:rubisco accumulation factor 1, chloroplastic [Dorcoceras hygrometricum]|uniref:Rubisco accumulation factor 1, chloroplastic n=1 Tax=Dorcoceras hygrometricum TaxID=472368 RepID=A0A2Z7AQ12_9LAMI|nr:rubisco accumulation factor 1, chloroplastic [Dorcoceras hygrometricum]
MVSSGRTNPETETHRAAQKHALHVFYNQPTVRPISHFEPLQATPRTTMNPLRLSHNPSSVPLTEAMQENTKTVRCT